LRFGASVAVEARGVWGKQTPADAPRPTRGSAVATDGYERWLLGLGKPFVRAYDKRNGELVGEIEVPAPVRGVPMTYLHEGRQYIAMPVAEPTNGRPRLIALALPR